MGLMDGINRRLKGVSPTNTPWFPLVDGNADKLKQDDRNYQARIVGVTVNADDTFRVGVGKHEVPATSVQFTFQPLDSEQTKQEGKYNPWPGDDAPTFRFTFYSPNGDIDEAAIAAVGDWAVERAYGSIDNAGKALVTAINVLSGNSPARPVDDDFDDLFESVQALLDSGEQPEVSLYVATYTRADKNDPTKFYTDRTVRLNRLISG